MLRLGVTLVAVDS